MLKRIPKSDISIRPFKAYKEWSFDETSTEITLLEANVTSSISSSHYPKNSIYGQLKAQFYNGLEDNPFLRFGDKTNVYETSNTGRDRFLNENAKVISIPQIYVGEGIKKGSVSLTDNGKTYVDISGNLIDSAGDYIDIVLINLEDNEITFTDNIDTQYDASFQTAVGDFDIESGTFNLIYNGISYDMNIISFDIQSNVMVIENIPFIDDVYVKLKIGNIFYTQGLVVITRNVSDLLLTGWDLSFKSTKTIYEHEYLLIANEDEFNVSQNPSAVVEIGKVTEFITGSDNKIYRVTTNPGTKYIKKKSILETGEILDYRIPSQYTSSISGGFEHYDLSGSVDSTGSFLTPFITTIGLYDDNCDLVAVAKLPQPIKSEPDIPVNFIVRFDT
jgi:hypothetical protein